MFFRFTFLIMSLILCGCKAKPVEKENPPCLTVSSQPIQDISQLRECQYNGSGPVGVCLSVVSVPPDQVDRLAKCGENMVCAPKKMAAYGLRLPPTECKSMIGLEGRCMSLLIPEVKDQEAFLPRDICEEDELCSPCYDPTTGEDTKACTLAPASCNAGPVAAPYVLECPYVGSPILDINKLTPCEGCPGTHCLPASRVPDNQKDLLEECENHEGIKGYCAPDKSIEAGSMYVPPTCRTPDGSEGRCTLACLPTIKAQEYGVWQMDCPNGEVCAPCYDPITLEDTGACHSAPCDQPVEPALELECPYTGPPMVHVEMFAPCDCSGTYCAPESRVPENQRSLLRPCDGGFCVPDKMLQGGGNYVPPTCRTPDGSEGRCVSSCLPDVQEQAYGIWQMDCPNGEVCAPCYDPLTGEDLGACRAAPCDGPAEPYTGIECPYKGDPMVHLEMFEKCDCPGMYCAPESRVPEDQRKMLEKCDGGFCVPDKMLLSGGSYVPPTCRTPDGSEGRCLSPCLPDIQEQAYGIWQMDCPDGDVCAPCFDPRNGEDLGACHTAPCDEPVEPFTEMSCPYDGDPLVHLEMFEPCSCDGMYCAPDHLVPEDQKDLLEKCEGGFCVTENMLMSNGNYVPPTCRTPDGSEGRCMSKCLPDIAAQDYGIWQMDCPDGEACAPCYNPQTCEDTGSCRSAPCDSPEGECEGLDCPYEGEPVVDVTKLSPCPCENTYCAPEVLVAEDLRPQLDTCDGGYCVPKRTLEHGGNYVRECRALHGTLEGRCQSTCLPAIIKELDLLTQEDCPDGEVCAPCYHPLTGEDMQACRAAPCDSPKEDKKIFDHCYENTARCVPQEMVPEDDRGDLSRRTCAFGELCVPNELVEDPDYKFQACSPSGQDGACVPVAVGSLDLIRSTLDQGPCPDNHLCVPCDVNLLIINLQTGACDKLE